MKRIITLLLAWAAVLIPLLAQESGASSGPPSPPPSTPTRTEIELHRTTSSPKVIRTPPQSVVKAFYNTETNNIEVVCNTDALGEVYLYHDDVLVDYDSQLNTFLFVPASGIYRLVICAESWEVHGTIIL